jgi:hypothetical protein
MYLKYLLNLYDNYLLYNLFLLLIYYLIKFNAIYIFKILLSVSFYYLHISKKSYFFCIINFIFYPAICKIMYLMYFIIIIYNNM